MKMWTGIFLINVGALLCWIVAWRKAARRANEEGNDRDLLDWAETLLCNAECPKHCKPDEWRDILKRWRDAKHGVKERK